MVALGRLSLCPALIAPIMAPAQTLPRRLGSALLLAMTLAGLGNRPAMASSPQAWEAYGRQVLQACRAASSLRNPRRAGERVEVPSANGSPTSVLLLQGSYPQPHMAGSSGLELCLYDGASRRARVTDADRLIQPMPTAPRP